MLHAHRMELQMECLGYAKIGPFTGFIQNFWRAFRLESPPPEPAGKKSNKHVSQVFKYRVKLKRTLTGQLYVFQVW